MKAVIDKLKKHKEVVFLGILVSIIVSFPQVYFRIDQKEVYQGIELLPDSPWSARVREVQDGHHNFGSMYYKDGKDLPYFHPPLGSIVVAYLGKIFFLDINNTLLLSRIILSFVVFVLFYGFVYLFLNDKSVALTSASLVLLADTALSPYGIRQILSGISPSSFLELARPVNSGMIFIPFFGFLISFWLFYRKRSFRYGVLSSILLGLNFYNYFYTWTYLYAFGGVLVLISLLQKNWQEAKRLSYIFLGAVVLAVPYIVNLYRATNHPVYEEVAQRFGLVSSHAPMFVGWVVIISIILFITKFPKQDREKYLFGLALALAPFVTMNQQVITGRVLQVGHYHWYFHKPVAIVLILATLFHWLRMRDLHSLKRLSAIALILFSFASGFFTQAYSYLNDRPGRDGGYIAIERQKYGPVVKWLDENGKKEAVVFATHETSHLVVVYTSLNVFFHRSAHISLAVPRQRILDALFTFYRLDMVGVEEVRDTFYEDRVDISADVYGTYYRDLADSYEGIPDENLDEIISLYKDTLYTPTGKWLYDIWSSYDVEYLVWDELEEPLWDLDRFSYLEKKAEFGNIAIYRFNR